MENILNIVTANLIMVGCFLIPFVLIRISDIALGISIAQKKSISFNWKKFLWGLFYSLCAVVGIGGFITGISMIVPLMEMYNVIVDETVISTLNGINVIAIVIMVVTATVNTYGKDCFDKIKNLINKK